MVTGASRGIGRAIAEQLAADGYRLSLGLRNPEAFVPLHSGPGPGDHVQLWDYDAHDPSSASRWVESCHQRFGAVDGLIHCAGVFSRVGLLFHDGQEEDIDELWTVNVMGPWWLTRAAWPHLIRSGDARVITLVSMSGKRVKGNLAGYAASKFALMALCQTMRNMGWGQGIRVTAICPSWVNTDMAAAVQAIPKEEMTQPQDLAQIVSLLLRLPSPSVPFELCVNCQLET
jgi:NAD(P)-dependent dehydrogenase (short-subunit alcohol dehydrogenase family)